MSRHGYSHHSDFGSDAGGGLAALVIIAIVVLAYIAFRMAAYITHTLLTYHRVKTLWYSSGGFVGLLVLGGVLAIIYQTVGFLLPAEIAYLILFLHCVVVRRIHANTFMVGEGASIQEAILHRKWWSDNETAIAA